MAGPHFPGIATQDEEPRWRLYGRAAVLLFVFNLFVWIGTIVSGDELGDMDEVFAAGLLLAPIAGLLASGFLMVGSALMRKVQGRQEPRPWQLSFGVDQSLGHRALVLLMGVPVGLIAFLIVGTILL